MLSEKGLNKLMRNTISTEQIANPVQLHICKFDCMKLDKK